MTIGAFGTGHPSRFATELQTTSDTSTTCRVSALFPTFRISAPQGIGAVCHAPRSPLPAARYVGGQSNQDDVASSWPLLRSLPSLAGRAGSHVHEIVAPNLQSRLKPRPQACARTKPRCRRPLDTGALGDNARPNHVEFIEND